MLLLLLLLSLLHLYLAKSFRSYQVLSQTLPSINYVLTQFHLSAQEANI